jgi:hypothetical protein
LIDVQKNPDPNNRKRILFSLATSIIIGFASALALAFFLFSAGIINQEEINIQMVTFAWMGFTAILYSVFSLRLLRFSVPTLASKLVRNIGIAVAIGFLSTILTSWDYGSQLNLFLSSNTSEYFYFLMSHILPMWIFAAFVTVSVFSFDYTWRMHSPEAPITAEPAT